MWKITIFVVRQCRERRSLTVDCVLGSADALCFDLVSPSVVFWWEGGGCWVLVVGVRCIVLFART